MFPEDLIGLSLFITKVCGFGIIHVMHFLYMTLLMSFRFALAILYNACLYELLVHGR